ncbi:MAG: hypothetical protein EPO24_11430 [Bacteroidetes bacterium]|nr:MAG: hypothetical protein EPO24_11430 [Bacteroidota bacterium]
MKKNLNPLTYLERTDKWYLGGGNRLIWAPPFPVWLEYPGFWDKAHYYNREIEPVFTWTILDDTGNEIPLQGGGRHWDPSKLVTGYEICDAGDAPGGRTMQGSRFKIQETKCCMQDGALASVVRMSNKSNSSIKLHLIAWTVQQNYPSGKKTWIENINVQQDNISFKKYLQPHHADAPILPVICSIGLDQKITSYSINLSEGFMLQPHWKLTPFFEKFRNRRLQNECKLSGVSDDGLIYMALHTSIELQAKSDKALTAYFRVAPSGGEFKKVKMPLRDGVNSVTNVEKRWRGYFSSVPYFACTDEYFTRYYWYRWYGLKLNTINVRENNYQYPFVCEGIGYFRAPISYSAMCHIMENRWQKTAAPAQGTLLTFLSNQRKDGGFRGYIDMDFYRQEMFYHANWGKSLIELHRIHPDKQFLKQAYKGLEKYVQYFDRERDAEESGLYDIDNHYETGQEYMHRYLAVHPNADRDNWGDVFRLKGVDVTVYMYELKKALSIAAGILGKRKVEEQWRRGAEKIKNDMVEKMWDAKEEMFFDVNPETGKRTTVKAATCFYPYMTDIVTAAHVPGFKRHLLSSKEFWTTYPVPSSSVDDAYYHAEAEWKGKRMNCPWNGRVWPMTNSHIAEALAQTAIRCNDHELRATCAEFITKFIRMMYFDGDQTRPNCFEHYNPKTGQPSIYRGVDDYQHSWVVDLIMKYVAGLRVYDNNIIVDPFPFEIESFILDKVYVRGKTLRVERKGKEFSVSIGGKTIARSKVGQPLALDSL